MKRTFLLVIMALVCFYTRAQMVVANTDLLLDALQTPNMGLEIVTGERTTLGIHVFGNYKPWGKDMKIIGVQPEFRYFFSGRTFHKMFVGIGGIGASYNVHWSGKVYDGQAIGLGMTFGYVLNLSQRLNLDFHAGFGGVYYKRKEYYENDQYDEDYSIGGVERTNSQGYYLIPTRIGVSLSYILK